MAYAREAVANRLEDLNQPLPLVARISDWPADEEPALPDWLANILGLNAETIAREVKEGRVLMLLDSLDELGDSSNQDSPQVSFMKALSRCPEGNRVVVTCRMQDYQALSAQLALRGAVTLSPLSDTQMAEYLEKHPDLLAAVKGDEALRDMARTPLLLSLLAFAYAGLGAKAQEFRQLSESPRELRDKIFETYVWRRYEHERLKPHAKLPFTIDLIYQVLGYAATQGFIGEIVGSVEEKVGNTIGDIVQKPIESIEMLLGDRAAAFVDQVRRLHYMMVDNKGHIQFIHYLLRDHFGLSYYQIEVDRLLHNPAATVEDKITFMVILILKKIDQQIEIQVQYLHSIQHPYLSKGHQIDVETMKLKRLIDKRSQMFDMLRQIIGKYNQTAKGIIDSIGR